MAAVLLCCLIAARVAAVDLVVVVVYNAQLCSPMPLTAQWALEAQPVRDTLKETILDGDRYVSGGAKSYFST